MNKYSKWYYSIIETAKSRELTGYTERHHIIPKSLNGSNDESNLVRLTAREHFVCHRLLVKMVTSTPDRIKMLHALSQMRNANNKQQRSINSRIYAVCKAAQGEANRLRNTGKKMILSDAERKKRAARMMVNRADRTGMKHSPEAKSNISASRKGKPAYNKGQPALRFICQYCNKSIGGANNFARWHGDNCKKKGS